MPVADVLCAWGGASGSTLVRRVIERMAAAGCDEVCVCACVCPPHPTLVVARACHGPTVRGRAWGQVVLEAEATNAGALALYERLGFVRDKRLHHYYLNGSDAYRLKLWLS
jgi:ribosomal protein S18 acetylase RimI-like enzyme